MKSCLESIKFELNKYIENYAKQPTAIFLDEGFFNKLCNEARETMYLKNSNSGEYVIHSVFGIKIKIVKHLLSPTGEVTNFLFEGEKFR